LRRFFLTLYDVQEGLAALALFLSGPRGIIGLTGSAENAYILYILYAGYGCKSPDRVRERIVMRAL
jgi:hypothetical protein